MKKSLSVLLALCWIGLSLHAQIVVNASDYDAFFNSGSFQVTDTAPAITPGSAGAGITWDFSALNAHVTKSNTSVSPSTGLLGAAFPSSSLCLKQDTNYYYFSSSSSALEYLGYAGNMLGIGKNDALVYNNPETILTFPSAYSSNFSDAASYDSYVEYNAMYQGYWVDSIRQKGAVTVNSIIDAWGTIITPNATLPCLRQNVKKHIADTVWAKVFVGGYHYWIELYSDTSNIQSYSYISNSGGGLIAAIEYYEDSSAIAEVRWNPLTLPSITLQSKTDILCTGGNNGSAAVNVSGGTTPYIYLWNNAQTGSTATALIAGNYTVTVTDAVNSHTTFTVTMNEPPLLQTAFTSQTNVSCNSCNDGEVTVIGTGGTSPYAFSWSNSQTTGTATGLSPGIYSITVTDANSCSATGSITIDSLMVINASDYSFFTYGTELVVDTLPVVSPGSAGANVIWDLSGLNAHVLSQNSFMSPSAGALGSSYPLSNTCMKQDSLYYFFNKSSIVLNYWGASGNLLGNGANNAQVYDNPATVLTFPSSYNTSFSDTANYESFFEYNGMYQGVWVDSLREKETIITNSVMDGWGTVITPNETIPCLRQNILKHTIDSTWAKIFVGGYHYWIALYNDTSNIQSYTYLSTVSGNIIATLEYYADSNALVEAKWNPVTLPEVAVASQTNITCNGLNNGNATVSVSGGKTPYSYSWNTSPVQTTATATGLTAGTYTLTLVDSINNTTAISVTITEPEVLAVSITSANNANCGVPDGNTTVSANGGITGYTYSWSTTPVQTTATATGLSAGNYTVTVTDANGCTQTTQANISNNNAATLSIVSQTNNTCNGDSQGSATASATGGTGTLTYTWSTVPMQNGLAATGLAAGTYSVTITDTVGCAATKSVTITEPSALTASITQTNASCNGGNNGEAGVTPAGGTAGYTYQWSTSPAQATATATGLIAGIHSVTVTDANGCTKVTSATISEPSVLTAAISAQTNVNCNGGSNGAATATATGGTANYTYLWNTSPAQTTVNATGLIAGSYSVTVTDANGCTQTASATITEPSVLTASISIQADVSCNGGNNGEATVSANGGTPNYTYNWSTIPSQTTASASGLTTGSYTVTITDANGCMATTVASIAEPAFLSVSIAGTDPGCNGGNDGEAAATVSGGISGYSYSWNTTPVQTTDNATGLSSGIYSITVTDANGCIQTASTTINEPAALTASVSSQTNVSCNGDNDGEATVTASGGTSAYTYLWSTTPAQSSATATGLPAGSYSVTVTDANGCTQTAASALTEPSALTTSKSLTNDNGTGNGTATVTASGGTLPYSYSWGNGQNTATATGLTAGAYSVTVTDDNGCQVTDTVIILLVSIQSGGKVNFDVLPYPNPSSGAFKVDVISSIEMEAEIAVYDMHGRIMYNQQVKLYQGKNNHAIILHNCSGGIYNLQVTGSAMKINTPVTIMR